MLQTIAIYLLKVTCISGLLFLYYLLALRNKQFHFYNRFYLLMVFIVSAIVPVLKLQWFAFGSGSSKTIQLLQIINGTGEPDVLVKGNTSLNWQQIILYLLAVTSFCILLFLISRIIHIYRLKKKF